MFELKPNTTVQEILDNCPWIKMEDLVDLCMDADKMDPEEVETTGFEIIEGGKGAEAKENASKINKVAKLFARKLRNA